MFSIVYLNYFNSLNALTTPYFNIIESVSVYHMQAARTESSVSVLSPGGSLPAITDSELSSMA